MSKTDTHIARRLARRLVPAAVAVTALACAAPAFADSIAYSGSDGNIWLTTPDGARQHQVTKDGTTSQRYRNPTQANDGTILAIRERIFHFLNQNGTASKPQWLAPVGASFYKSPLSAHIAPDGGLVTWAYIHSAHVSEPPTQRVAFSTPGATSPCVVNCHSGYHDPRWIPNTPYAAMISTDGNALAVQEQGASQPVPYLTFNNDGDFEGFDFSRTGNKIVYIATPNGTPPQGQHEQGVLQFFQAQGPPRAQANFVCATPLGDETSEPRFSPDGSKITWSDQQGVWVSNAPTGGGNGACNLNPRLIVPGGQNPDFGTANLPGGGGQNGGGENGGGENGGGQNGGQNGDNTNNNQDNHNHNNTQDQPATITGLSGGRVKLARALSKGYPVAFSTTEGGRATVSLSASGSNARGLKVVMAKTVRVAGGSKALPGAGQHRVTAKFTSKARRRLRRLRRVTLTVQVTVVDSAGNSATESKRVTLKR
jgi:hypothetical protein